MGIIVGAMGGASAGSLGGIIGLVLSQDMLEILHLTVRVTDAAVVDVASIGAAVGALEGAKIASLGGISENEEYNLEHNNAHKT